MRVLVAPTLALLFVAAGTLAAADLKSGLEVGQKAGPFNVKDITGENKGKSLCLRWRLGARPVVNVFARELTDDLASLVKQLDAAIAKNAEKKMAGFVVLLSENPDADEAKVKEFAEKHGIKVLPLTIFEGIAGPPEYNLAKEADVTINMWVKTEVKANLAFAKGGLNKAAIKKVLAETEKILN